MRARRAAGEGSVHKRRQGGWQGSVAVGIVAGRRKRKTVYGATQREVLDKLGAIRRTLDAGLPVGTSRPITLADYLEAWLRDTLPTLVRPSTAESYSSLTKQHIIPGSDTTGSTSSPPCTSARSSGTRASRPARGRSGRCPPARSSTCTPSCALRSSRPDATTWWCATSPAWSAGRRCSAPKSRRSRSRRRAGSSPRRPPTASPLWLLVTALGLRRGEALALRWADVDLDGGHLQVKASVQRVGGKLVRTEMPKTKSSRRALPLPAVVVDALRAHRAAQVQERLASAVWIDDTLVFTTGIGTPLDPRNVLRSFHALCDRAQVRRVRIHDLRHAAASFMLLQGVDMRVVMGTLGHSAGHDERPLHTPARAGAARRRRPDGRPTAPGQSWPQSLITAVAVCVAVRDAKEEPPESGRPL